MNRENMDEPIRHFYNKSGFDRSQISRYLLGDKFVCIMLTDGRIGICSTLGSKINNKILDAALTPDLDDPGDRIILNAYFNALHNYDNNYEAHSDIFDAIDFTVYSAIVMIGFFETLYEKFKRRNIALKVFDRMIENRFTEPVDRMDEALGKAEAVVVTGTTLFNGSLPDILAATSRGCSVFLLGPSNILHPDIFKYPNVTMVFGSVFNKFDTKIFEQVERGVSAREFLKIENKVFIRNNSDF